MPTVFILSKPPAVVLTIPLLLPVKLVTPAVPEPTVTRSLAVNVAAAVNCWYKPAWFVNVKVPASFVPVAVAKVKVKLLPLTSIVPPDVYAVPFIVTDALANV